MENYKTKQEKREIQAQKIEIKQKKGATFAGQVNRMKCANKYKGSVKKMI